MFALLMSDKALGSSNWLAAAPDPRPDQLPTPVTRPSSALFRCAARCVARAVNLQRAVRPRFPRHACLECLHQQASHCSPMSPRSFSLVICRATPPATLTSASSRTSAPFSVGDPRPSQAVACVLALLPICSLCAAPPLWLPPAATAPSLTRACSLHRDVPLPEQQAEVHQRPRQVTHTHTLPFSIPNRI